MRIPCEEAVRSKNLLCEGELHSFFWNWTHWNIVFHTKNTYQCIMIIFYSTPLESDDWRQNSFLDIRVSCIYTVTTNCSIFLLWLLSVAVLIAMQCTHLQYVFFFSHMQHVNREQCDRIITASYVFKPLSHIHTQTPAMPHIFVANSFCIIFHIELYNNRLALWNRGYN